MADLKEGLVVAHLGKGLAVEHNGLNIICHTRRQLGNAVVGDRVLWLPSAPDQGRVDKILPRRSLLTRPGRNGSTRPVAANIDRIFIVFAIKPRCDFLLIDQYLAVCEHNNISATLLLNKTDLDIDTPMEKELSDYQQLGYKLFRISAKSRHGLNALDSALHNQVSMFTGQSGVGKSTLTNALIPDKQLKTNSLSVATEHGRHTTTAATLYHLPGGGDLIDSPGVAIFGLAGFDEQQLASGFREFQPLIEQCRFHNCKHVQDKGCAVRQAAEESRISINRYQRFLKLREKLPPANLN